jgi:hypothetical protein
MMEPDRKASSKGVAPPKDEDEVYGVAAPGASPVSPSSPAPRPDPRFEPLPLRPQTRRDADEEPPPPPAHFLAGILRFPWYVQSLGPWVLCSFGLALSLMGVVLAVWLVDVGLTMAVYAMRFSICWVVFFSVSYVSACLLAIIEGTASGNDEITDWPKGDWRDNVISMVYPVGMLVLACLVGWAAWWLTLRVSWAVPVAVGFLVYPVFLLSAMENGSALGFISRPILRTCLDVWWAWLVLYALSGAMIAGWLVWAVLFFPSGPFVTAGVSGPILAAILFLYARLLGRLAWWGQKAAADRD